jgi:hypothetical protein
VLETHRFGPHTVVVLETLEDEGPSYSVLVDDEPVVDVPLAMPPDFEDVVRLYARWKQPVR